MPKIIGIDLGTTYSVCAFVDEKGQPKVIPSSEGRNLVPSVVEPQKRLVGDFAKGEQIAKLPKTIFSVKRLMGRRFEDESVQYDAKHLPFTIKEGREGMAVIEIEGKTFTPQEISAMILQKIKRDAESFFGKNVTEAVITVPAYFDDGQRQATKQAGEMAGFKVRRIINEPTAASLAYGLGKRKGEKIVVYDLGGGTFDVSVLETGEGVFEVMAVSGDTHLGGDDFDQRITDLLAKEFKLRKDRRALQQLRVVAEKAKVALTSSLETEISVPSLHISRKFTRAELEWLTSDLIGKTLTLVERALSDAKLSPQDIDEVVLVGGMTRMPAVREGVRKYFGEDPHTGVNPDEVVAIGAAIQGAILAGEIKGITLIDVNPLSLGIETLGGLVSRLIKRNTPIPISVSRIFSTAADDQTSVEIRILQGERELSADNRSLGLLKLDDIPPAPRAVPRIEVAFEIDSNGILHVFAKDLSTDRGREITVAGSTGLSGEEVERMIKEVEVCAEGDRKKREHVTAINQATDLIYAAEQVLSAKGGSTSGGKEKRGNVPQNIRKEIKQEIKELRTLLEIASTEELHQKIANLSASLQVRLK